MSSEEISIDSANFVLLSLIRELYNLAEQSTPIEAKEYKKQIKQKLSNSMGIWSKTI